MLPPYSALTWAEVLSLLRRADVTIIVSKERVDPKSAWE
jgi:hypothetical protein